MFLLWKSCHFHCNDCRGQLWGSDSCHINISDDISPHTSHYTIYLSPLSLWEQFQGPFIYRTSSLWSVTFIFISRSPQGIWTTSQSITTMQIPPLLTIQIMIRWSSDFINTLAYTLHHMSRSHVWCMRSTMYKDGLKIWVSLRLHLSLTCVC